MTYPLAPGRFRNQPNIALSVWLGTFLCAALAPLCGGQTTVFSSNTTIAASNTAFDGNNIVVSDCVVAVNGSHSFANVQLVSNAILSYVEATHGSVQGMDVDGGSVLKLCGGLVFEVAGTLTATNNSSILCQGTNVSGQVSNQWVGAGVTILASNVTIAAGAAISADGQGYVGGNGPGAGTGGYNSGAGGGYGGMGRSIGCAAGGGATYGSGLFPTDLGSGGAGDHYVGNSSAGTGGGAIEMTVLQTLTLNGVISANGTNQIGGAGNGSGGSILLTVNTLAGSGFLEANGGANNGPAGGGGRIAAYYTNAASFTNFSNCTVNGANPGTMAFFEAGAPNMGLNLFGRLILPGGATNHYAYVSLNDGAALTLGGGSTLQVDGLLEVQSNATMICEGTNASGQVSNQWVGVGVTILASNVTIAAGATISADGQGYTGGNGPGAGAQGYNSGAGGGYGGMGGANDSGSGGGATYGSDLLPTALGSGGGGDHYAGNSSAGTGGGAIEMNVAQTLTLNGVISANGTNQSGGAGNGSGGSILLMVNSLIGSGSLQANGGTYGGGGIGGGGRIAAYYTNVSSVATLKGCTATGANPGTAVLFDTTVPNLGINLFSLLGLAEGVTNHYGAVALYSGATLIMGGGSTLLVDGLLQLESNSTMICQGINTSAQVSNQWVGAGVTIQAGNVIVAEGAAISADGQGYTGGNGPGGGTGGYNSGSGGSYGGMGGTNDLNGSGGPTYGSATDPTDLGSGGGPNHYHGDSSAGSGGGAIKLSAAQTLTLDGVISANGTSQVSGTGNGSGGSLLLMANTLTGSGTLQANGATGGGGASGGGGRIVAYIAQALTYPSNSITASAGGSDAQPGTVAIVIKRPELQLQPSADGGVLTWGAFPIYSYQLQESTDLRKWLNVGTNMTPSEDTFIAVSNVIQADPQRAFRVVELP